MLRHAKLCIQLQQRCQRSFVYRGQMKKRRRRRRLLETGGIDGVIKELGSQGSLARALGVNATTVNYWARVTKQIPAKHVLALEEATGIHRRSIRPDLYN